MNKNIIIITLLLLAATLLFGCAGNAALNKTPSDPELDTRDYCRSDADCVCGGVDTYNGQCFMGNKDYYEKYVDKSGDCADFCGGIAGNMEIRCVDNQCIQMYECVIDTDCASGSCVDNQCTGDKTPPPSKPAGECSSDSDCKMGGCSGQLCIPKSARERVTTCEYHPKYDCLSMISCGCIEGKCAWDETEEYDDCVKNAIGASDPVI